MHGNEVFVFLLSLAVLLGVARLLGEVGRRFGLPQVVGELLTGVILGQTGLRRVAPAAYDYLFPTGTPATMLSGYTTVAVVLLLVVAGLEVDLGIVKRRGRTAISVAALGIVLPLIGGFVIGQVVPDHIIGSPEHRTLFSLFMGVALSISALPVIAKTLLDLGLFKTDVGLLVMTAAMVDDLVGWMAFSILLGPMHGGGIHFATFAKTIGLTGGFVLVMLFVGRPLADRVIAKLEEKPEQSSGRILSFAVVMALLGASITQWIGIHAVLGGFVVGLTVGDSPRLREPTRHTIHQFVTNIFAPVFFAGLGLRIDFFQAFDPTLCLTIFLVATIAKLAGCSIGARFTGLPWRQSFAVGFGLNARGAMEILLAVLAREAKLIGDEVFVALILMAIGTSLLAGPMMMRLLYPERARKGDDGLSDDAATLVRNGRFIPALSATTPAHAIDELGHSLRDVIGDLVEPATISVLERELEAPTGLGDEVAIPHAAVPGLPRPVVALGLSADGIDFDAPDGRAAKIVFLLLLPPKAYEREVHVLAALARSVFDEPARNALLAAKSSDDAVRCLDENGRRVAGQTPAVRIASLTDM